MNYTIPQYFIEKNINPSSPSQANMPVDQWYWKYFVNNQETRRKFATSAKMWGGIYAGNAIEEWVGNGNSILRMLDVPGYKDYVGINEKDQRQHELNQDSFADTVKNAYAAYDEIGITKSNKVIFENYVSGTLEDVVLPIIGRTDAQSKNIVIELKTKWSMQKSGTKKDGTPFAPSKSKSPNKPDYNHLLQTAFYYNFTKDVKAYLVYATEQDYKIFDIDDYNPKRLIEQFRLKLLVKQKLASHTDGKEFIEPDFSHYAWNIGEEFLEQAKEYYGYK